jgi:hypothetical protein
MGRRTEAVSKQGAETCPLDKKNQAIYKRIGANMKKIVFFMVLFNTVLFTVMADTPVLTVVNDTGFDIYFLYISRASSDSWEEDLLGEESILENGESIKVTLPASGAWDLRAEDEDEDTYTLLNLKVTKDTRVVISLDNIDAP